MRLRRLTVGACLALSFGALLPPAEAAERAVGWRNDGTGSFPDADPPTQWGPASNVVWKTKLPSWSNASPILVGDRLFVCAEPATLLCVSAADGRILWQGSNTYLDVVSPDQLEAARAETKQAEDLQSQVSALDRSLKEKHVSYANSSNQTEQAAVTQEIVRIQGELEPLQKQLQPLAEKWLLPYVHPTCGYSAPTPTSDGQFVYALFGNGVAVCYDRDGNRRWARRLERVKHDWGHSRSPLLARDRVIVQIRDLVALDAATGSNVWQVASEPHCGSPVLTRIGDTDVLVTAAGDFVKVSDGTVLARKLCPLDYVSPLLHSNVVYFIQYGGKAIQLPAAVGDTFEAKVLWETKPDNDRYYASPAYVDGLLYTDNWKGGFSVIDAATGNVVATNSAIGIKGYSYPSVTRAGSYLYVGSEAGDTVVLELGLPLRTVATNQLEAFRSSPVFAGKRMYIRALQHLYCIGQ